MAYAPTNFYIPSDPTIQSSTFLFYPPQAPSLSLLPGEAASAYYSYSPSGIPSSAHALNSAHVCTANLIYVYFLIIHLFLVYHIACATYT